VSFYTCLPVDDRLAKLVTWLEDVSADDIAILFDGAANERIQEVAELLAAVRQLVAPSAFPSWLHLNLARLGGTPIEAIRLGRMADVLTVIRTYPLSSFK